MDEILSRRLEQISTLAEASDLVYAAAVSVCEMNDVQLSKSNSKPQSEPPWKTRLKGKVIKISKKIGILHTYLNTAEPSRKLLKWVREVASEFAVKVEDPTFKQKITTIYIH
ncbi:hypothetical protein HHI36_009956 [Cryptolaemus montrouzieri]|uniref:Uncharacterized protein n=1 Tax=Cryptolaemus montrouzieri TaxID=559131 RepID=A0ABD2MHE9_9CUCU